MNKKTMSLIILATVMIVIVLVLVCNKTFLKSYYEVTNGKEETVNIPLPLFSYLESESGKYEATFKTLRRPEGIRGILGNYVENLVSCYDESYFYDKERDITISRYEVQDEFPFNKITLVYTKGDYCEKQYVLDDNWLDEFREKAVISEAVVTHCLGLNTEKVACSARKIKDYDSKEVYDYVNGDNTTRVDNKNNITYTDSNHTYRLNIYYTIGNMGYELVVFSYDTNYLAFKVIDSNDHQKNAIYDIGTDSGQILKDVWDANRWNISE